jgi:hypothetical protein
MLIKKIIACFPRSRKVIGQSLVKGSAAKTAWKKREDRTKASDVYCFGKTKSNFGTAGTMKYADKLQKSTFGGMA